MYKALYLSPMVPSFNIRETLNFFVELFSFKGLPGMKVIMQLFIKITISFTF